MDEKTEDLRELFVDVAGTDTVTEGQEAERGTLADVDEATVERKLAAIVAQMREEFTFEADLDDAERVRLVRAFYRGEDDPRLADRLSTDVETIRAARLELHLFRESDTDSPIEWERFREHLETEDDDAVLATELDLDAADVRHYRRVVAAREEARRVSHRYRSAFRDVIPDADLADRLTEGVTDDGLGDAAADIETNVSF